MTKEQIKALRKAGLGDVCLYNDEYMRGDGRALYPDEKARVLAIISGGFDPHFPPKKAAPAKHKKGRGKQ